MGTKLSLKLEDISVDNKLHDSSMPYILEGFEEHVAKIAISIKENFPVLLVGPTGCGKTSIVKHLAEVTGNTYRRIQVNGSTGVDSFVGRWLINKSGTFWVDGILTDAMRKGHWLLLDEINAALPEILFILHSILDDDRVLILDEKDGEMVTPHPNFRLFAAMNPPDLYAGTKELNKALLDRFPIQMNFEYMNPIMEEKIIALHTGLSSDEDVDGTQSITNRLVTFANALRGQQAEGKILFTCSTRQLIHVGTLVKYLPIKQAIITTIINKADTEDISFITDEMNKLFRNKE